MKHSLRSLAKGRRQAFTLFELLVTIVIVTVLGSVLVAGMNAVRQKADMVVCQANLRVLHQAFANYTVDNGYWPQKPEDLTGQGHVFYDWIVGEVTPYGGGRQAWVCPSEARELRISPSNDEFVGSYVPTLFSAESGKPWQWRQPWLLERGNNHGKGAQLIMPDGSIQTTVDAIYSVF